MALMYIGCSLFFYMHITVPIYTVRSEQMHPSTPVPVIFEFNNTFIIILVLGIL